jgi:hypothetical protein
MLIVVKISRTNDEGTLDSHSNLEISLSKPPKLPFVMVQFMKSVYNDISRTLSKNYHALLRSYHGTMPGIIFFRHVFQFCRVEKPVNDTFVVDTCHTCPSNLSPFLIKGMKFSKHQKHDFPNRFGALFHGPIV